MSIEKDPTFLALQRYVNAAADLAEQVQRDIRDGSEISDATIIKLSQFKDAAQSVESTLDKVIPFGVKYN